MGCNLVVPIMWCLNITEALPVPSGEANGRLHGRLARDNVQIDRVAEQRACSRESQLLFLECAGVESPGVGPTQTLQCVADLRTPSGRQACGRRLDFRAAVPPPSNRLGGQS